MAQKSRVRPLEAAQAIARLIRDPNATEEVFRIVRALDGDRAARLVRRLKSSDEGRRLLRDKPDLLSLLSDRDALAAMPSGSLGRQYLAFRERENIMPDGLVEASQSEERALLDEDELFAVDRIRETHDLWHVVTGYHTDLVGENALLSFTAAQTESPGVFVIAAAGYLSSWVLNRSEGEGRAVTREGWKRGKRASWLVEAHWEELLPLPLDEVRAKLGLTDVPEYERVYPEDIGLVARAA